MQAAAGEIVLEIGQAGGGHTFDELVALHQQRVVRTAYRLLGRTEDAQDAAQEAFLRLWKNMHRIQGDPQAWLYRVTVNLCKDHYRRSAPAAARAAETPDPAPGPERVLALEERKRLLMDGLQTLPERERAAVVLRDIEGLSTREVAEILEVAEVTVRSHISSARLKLAKYLRKMQ
ncbi:MAG TPA: RNA polymerase sigma factor [Bryobacteraceae bacterium]|jgi:RNA polymerase sigma-70 factor (ECF subfamily)